MVFSASTYEKFVSEKPLSQTCLFPEYLESNYDFDAIIISSGSGGGVLADDLAERIGKRKRILVLEAGSFLYPTHIYHMVEKFKQSSLSDDFIIKQTPRALHQPYLNSTGAPNTAFFTEPTGVFNTAELLIHQVDLASKERNHDGPGWHLLLNKFVENVEQINDGHAKYRVDTTDTIDGKFRSFRAKTVVLCGGSIESPKFLRRSSVYGKLPGTIAPLIGRGLTDHPTTHEVTSFVSHMDDLEIPLHAHAKMILYSEGNKTDDGQIRYLFNVEINVNHEYWHLRENEPSDPGIHPVKGDSRIDFKFGFGDPVDDGNTMILSADNYVPNLQFKIKGFGTGAVHHAGCSLRMPFRQKHDGVFQNKSIADEDLQVRGSDGLYVCDMSVMPFSSAANPVMTLVASSLRLSKRLARRV
ncbi:hypothetical protein MFIFM68171_06273 [Madurella fahalii]|uniref:Uncharacterized protein n=1 Tax=Madurella fahalii TaxID=1157608 RepID=A0ABQ0GE64_9PEZI